MVGRCLDIKLHYIRGRRDLGQGGSKRKSRRGACQRGSTKGSKRQPGRNACQIGPTKFRNGGPSIANSCEFWNPH